MARTLLEYGILVFSGVLYAIALKYFVFPAQVLLTGTEGIATALAYYFDRFWVFLALYVTFQSLFLGFAFARVSRVFAQRSLCVVATVVVALAILPELKFANPEPQQERMLLVLFGGILAGAAKAIAFTYQGSTGDEDIPAAYLASKYLKPVGSIAIVAAVISTTFGLTMQLLQTGRVEPAINTLMYTCIYIFAAAETLNNLYRKFEITMLVVITRCEEQVGTAIRTTSTHRTYTVQQGVGGRTGGKYSLLRTIITHEELPEMLSAVQQADENCFYYYHNIEGISGRYYITPIGTQRKQPKAD